MEYHVYGHKTVKQCEQRGVTTSMEPKVKLETSHMELKLHNGRIKDNARKIYTYKQSQIIKELDHYLQELKGSKGE